MNTQRPCSLLLVVLLAVGFAATPAVAQYPGGFGPQAAYAPPAAYAPQGAYAPQTAYGGMPAMGMPGGMQAMSGMPGGLPPYGVHPAAFQAAVGSPDGGYYGGEGYADDGSGGYGDAFCDDGYCGDGCRPRHGRDLLDMILPHGEGGICAPRWFDLHFDLVHLARDKASRQTIFSRVGDINGQGAILLSSDSLQFDDEYGFRGTAAVQMGPGSNVEFSYLGAFNFTAAAQAADPNANIFGPFSNFGAPPVGFIGDMDQAFLTQLAYSSAFNSFELNYRRRWQGANCRLQGSWLLGMRYFDLTEDLLFNTWTNNVVNGGLGFTNYGIRTNNSLLGAQLGGDAWLTLIPGLRIGGELKAGIYGNQASQQTSILSRIINPALIENVEADAPAFIGEAAFMAIYRVNYHWTFRAGYQFLFVDGVALAPENFNATPPNVLFPNAVRTPTINHNGNVFYHGLTLGLEFMW